MKKTIIYGCGHSNQTLENFIANLKKYKIDLLLDIRTFPYSRFSPQFNQRSLDKALPESGIEYLWFGDRLGGRGENRDYDGAINWLAEIAKTKNVCVMCSEKDYLKCHRHTMLEPSLQELSVVMLQI